MKAEIAGAGYVGTDARGLGAIQPPLDDLHSLGYTLDVPENYQPVLTRARHVGHSPMQTFWLHRAGGPNFYDAAALAKSIVRGANSDEERCVRLLNSLVALSRPGRVWEDGTEANQPNVAVYRSRLCTQASEAFGRLTGALGIPSRGVGVGWKWRSRQFGHGFCELFVQTRRGAKWVMFDPYMGVAVQDEAGALLSFAEAVRSEASARAQGKPIGGAVSQALANRFAFLDRPGASYGMRGIATFPAGAYLGLFRAALSDIEQRDDSPPKAEDLPDPERIRRTCHGMAFSLVPGQTIEWRLSALTPGDLKAGRGGIHCVLPLRREAIQGAELNELEADVLSELSRYGNGVVTTRFPDSASSHSLVAARRNVVIQQPGGVRLASPGTSGCIVLQITCPYVMVGGRVRLDAVCHDPADTIVLSVSPLREQPKAYREWRQLWSGRGPGDARTEIDLGPVFQRVGPKYVRSESATYSFLLRIEMAGAPVVRQLVVVAAFQGTLASFPSATAGAGAFTLYSSEPLSAPVSVSRREDGARLALTVAPSPVEIVHVLERTGP